MARTHPASWASQNIPKYDVYLKLKLVPFRSPVDPADDHWLHDLNTVESTSRAMSNEGGFLDISDLFSSSFSFFWLCCVKLFIKRKNKVPDLATQDPWAAQGEAQKGWSSHVGSISVYSCVNRRSF